MAAESPKQLPTPQLKQSNESVVIRSIKDITAGTVAGVGITLVGHPFDTLKVRLQTQSHTNPIYSGLGDCIRKIYKSEGLGGFYKGVASPLVGQMVFNAVQFAAYGQAKDFVRQGKEMTLTNYFQAGALTGGVIAFVECPIDLFKTQLQTQIFVEKPRFTTFFGTVGYIFSNYGIRGCLQGIGPTICRNVPAVAGYFGAYEFGRMKLRAPGQSIDQLESWKLLLAGSAGGFAYWSFTYPIDVVKSAMQSDSVVRAERRFKSMPDCIRQLYAEGGIARFFKGVTPCLLRAAPANAVCFTLYQKTAQFLEKY